MRNDKSTSRTKGEDLIKSIDGVPAKDPPKTKLVNEWSLITQEYES